MSFSSINAPSFNSNRVNTNLLPPQESPASVSTQPIFAQTSSQVGVLADETGNALENTISRTGDVLGREAEDFLNQLLYPYLNEKVLSKVQGILTIFIGVALAIALALVSLVISLIFPGSLSLLVVSIIAVSGSIVLATFNSMLNSLFKEIEIDDSEIENNNNNNNQEPIRQQSMK